MPLRIGGSIRSLTLNVPQAEQAFRELEGSMVASQRHFAEMTAQRQNDFATFRFERACVEHLRGELKQAQSQVQEDREVSAEFNEVITSEFAGGNANFQALEDRLVAQNQTAPLIHRHYKGLHVQFQTKWQEELSDVKQQCRTTEIEQASAFRARARSVRPQQPRLLIFLILPNLPLLTI